MGKQHVDLCQNRVGEPPCRLCLRRELPQALSCWETVSCWHRDEHLPGSPSVQLESKSTPADGNNGKSLGVHSLSQDAETKRVPICGDHWEAWDPAASKHYSPGLPE